MFVSYLTAAFLGLVQGLTEFLPVSSSGHLALLQNIFHMEEADQMFDAMLHLGTLLAVFLTCKNDVRGLLRGALGLLGPNQHRRSRSSATGLRKRLALLVLLGTVPLVLVIPFYGKLTALMENSMAVGLMLLVNGGILYGADRLNRQGKDLTRVTPLDAILVGLGQALGAIPGISRSGSTISMGMVLGFQKSFAVRFSLLLSLPAVLGGSLVSMVDALRLGVDPGMLPLYAVGMLFAAISGIFGIRILRWAAARNRFGGFSYYCWGAGMVALLLSLVA